MRLSFILCEPSYIWRRLIYAKQMRPLTKIFSHERFSFLQKNEENRKVLVLIVRLFFPRARTQQLLTACQPTSSQTPAPLVFSFNLLDELTFSANNFHASFPLSFVVLQIASSCWDCSQFLFSHFLLSPFIIAAPSRDPTSLSRSAFAE